MNANKYWVWIKIIQSSTFEYCGHKTAVYYKPYLSYSSNIIYNHFPISKKFLGKAIQNWESGKIGVGLGL